MDNHGIQSAPSLFLNVFSTTSNIRLNYRLTAAIKDGSTILNSYSFFGNDTVEVIRFADVQETLALSKDKET